MNSIFYDRLDLYCCHSHGVLCLFLLWLLATTSAELISPPKPATYASSGRIGGATGDWIDILPNSTHWDYFHDLGATLLQEQLIARESATVQWLRRHCSSTVADALPRYTPPMPTPLPSDATESQPFARRFTCSAAGWRSLGPPVVRYRAVTPRGAGTTYAAQLSFVFTIGAAAALQPRASPLLCTVPDTSPGVRWAALPAAYVASRNGTVDSCAVALLRASTYLVARLEVFLDAGGHVGLPGASAGPTAFVAAPLCGYPPPACVAAAQAYCRAPESAAVPPLPRFRRPLLHSMPADGPTAESQNTDPHSYDRGGGLRFLSYNTWNFNEPWSIRLPGLGSLVASSHPDVVAYQEVRYDSDFSFAMPHRNVQHRSAEPLGPGGRPCALRSCSAHPWLASYWDNFTDLLDEYSQPEGAPISSPQGESERPSEARILTHFAGLARAAMLRVSTNRCDAMRVTLCAGFFARHQAAALSSFNAIDWVWRPAMVYAQASRNPRLPYAMQVEGPMVAVHNPFLFPVGVSELDLPQIKHTDDTHTRRLLRIHVTIPVPVQDASERTVRNDDDSGPSSCAGRVELDSTSCRGGPTHSSASKFGQSVYDVATVGSVHLSLAAPARAMAAEAICNDLVQQSWIGSYILCGDMNAEPNDVFFRAVKHCAAKRTSYPHDYHVGFLDLWNETDNGLPAPSARDPLSTSATFWTLGKRFLKRIDMIMAAVAMEEPVAVDKHAAPQDLSLLPAAVSAIFSGPLNALRSALWSHQMQAVASQKTLVTGSSSGRPLLPRLSLRVDRVIILPNVSLPLNAISTALHPMDGSVKDFGSIPPSDHLGLLADVQFIALR